MKKVFLYTLSTCSHCRATKRFLNEQGIDYDFIDVDLLEGDEKKQILEEVMKYNPQRSFPTIIIEGKVIVGHNEQAIKEALGLP
ncbi:MAG TPA: glutaredoxin family protein [Syntrophales bacterium]|nr:glutaredoxin family protein [Syntrophales bacterium]HOL59483.1 glutaredoxin family protein [Syntrophales bacterium]HPO34665.1 glutaredoxin family protein [Syntrophales bacterium]